MPMLPGLWMKPGMMPILQAPGVITPGQFGPTSRDLRIPERGLDLHHVVDRDALGDAHDERDTGVGRLEDRVRRVGRGHVDHARLGAGLRDRVAHGVEHRQTEVLLAASARRHAADQLGAVLEALLRVKGPLLARETLADDARVLVDEYGH